MSRPYSKNRVAVTVDQAIIESETTPPNTFLKSVKTANKAKKTKGSKEYPRILIVL